MGLFSARRRSIRGTHARLAASFELSEEQRAALPPRFEAVGEALAARSSVIEACWVAGRDLADMGVSLGESLEGLRSTTRLVASRDPSFEECQVLSRSWSEATLGYLHGLSCADPLTGLATLAHIRERIAELYRDAQLDARSHALVVAEVRRPPHLDQLASARRLTLVGHAARAVFAGQEAIGQVGPTRVVVVAPRDESLPARVGLLRRMVEDRADRVWIEGLPGSDASAAQLLDELARV
ncbi:hypothetical protein [Nocardioides sp.]|uniref:hypothetical protein n=1 Tax=Nocardioides sp. TaxID=35761 RepID=UPI0039E2CF9E